MKTFEVGKRYNDGAKARINKWENREVFFYNCYQIEA